MAPPSDDPSGDNAPLEGGGPIDPDGQDVRAALADVSVVVASRRDRNVTAETAPDWLETVVREDEGRSRARNRGVEEATGDWLVVADDDITFPTVLTAMLVEGMHQHHVVGLEDFWPLEWVLTRYVVFHRSMWDAVGGFDERREHGEDTDFAIRCEKAGGRVRPLPRRLVEHHDVDTRFEAGQHAEWLWYLLRRHPRRIAPKAALLGLRKVGLVSAPPDYPTGRSWADPGSGEP